MGVIVKILVAYERSGTVREAFRARGHHAFSCDLAPAEDGSDYHFRKDALYMARTLPWDLVIAHPPCTYLTGSAAWAFKDGPYHQKVKPGTLVGAERRRARDLALREVCELMALPVPRIAIENPRGFIGSMIRKPDQTIQPYQFGEDASKATCLWLKGLPLLQPTERVAGRMVDGKERWANQTDSGQNRLTPSDRRAIDRSRTYTGIANAMADQWGRDD